jgi:hypothetical protein
MKMRGRARSSIDVQLSPMPSRRWSTWTLMGVAALGAGLIFLIAFLYDPHASSDAFLTHLIVALVIAVVAWFVGTFVVVGILAAREARHPKDVDKSSRRPNT